MTSDREWNRRSAVSEAEEVYVPTPEERRMIDDALDDLRRDPGSGRSWDDVHEELQSRR